jgi:hypothetical protein
MRAEGTGVILSSAVVCAIVWRLLETRPGKRPRVPDIAGHLGMSDRRLRRLWRQERWDGGVREVRRCDPQRVRK